MIKNLKSLRQRAGISQQQLADVILVSQQSVNKYENHDVEPDISTLIKIADYFEVSLDYLVGRTNIAEMMDKTCMSDLSAEERIFVNNFRELNPKQKNCIKTIIESYI